MELFAILFRKSCYSRIALRTRAVTGCRRWYSSAVFASRYLIAALLSHIFYFLDDQHRFLPAVSNFGMLLDMIIDRSMTSGLLSYLCYLYPRYAFWFQLALCLDISSHYAISYAQISRSVKSHKDFGAKWGNSYILRKYYTSRIFLFAMCSLNEAFLISLYIHAKYARLHEQTASMSYGNWALTFKVLVLLTAPFSATKQVISIIQLTTAATALAQT